MVDRGVLSGRGGYFLFMVMGIVGVMEKFDSEAKTSLFAERGDLEYVHGHNHVEVSLITHLDYIRVVRHPITEVRQ